MPSKSIETYSANESNSAIDPANSATVSASAGTGKTWSLVSRIIRLLMDGADPGSVLAITFTRKAAAEMQSRLNERLLQLASSDIEELGQHLDLIGLAATDANIKSARQLYEKILYAQHPPRITTFHAMCQDLLRRFPFDANVPPGFELSEQTSELQNQAEDLLVSEATLNNNGAIAEALETLFNYCGSLDSTLSALENFLNHRSDWWAFTRTQDDPVAFAQDELRSQLKLQTLDDPALSFFDTGNINSLKEFADLLGKHPTSTNEKFLTTIQNVFDLLEASTITPAFDQVVKVFFTDKLEPRKRKSSKTQIKNMGAAGDARFIELHQLFVEKIEAINDIRASLQTYFVTSAWYVAGNRMLQYYQTIKTEQRILDFADLEWSAYLLLTEENHAAWVQYKLDARIDHVLIDEYQDTNPTQWQLLKPLLEEISSSVEDNSRTVFLVGDTKQSIYRFRRAQPKLFNIAQQWMDQHLNSDNSSLDLSRRSAPAIINFVNTVFSDGNLNKQIVDFEEHKTCHSDLWGQVTLAPLFMEPEISDGVGENNDEAQEAHFRNPLKDPLIIAEDQRRINEARFIASEIERVVSEPVILGNTNEARNARYSDIIILLGQRTHAAVYEQVLTEANIPYIGINKGTLLDTLEIKDISALLNLLVTPFDNLGLAQLLKSPLFACSDQDLISLASLPQAYWLDRLTALAKSNPGYQNINRACRLLSEWRQLAGKLPVHDLLDKVFSDSNLIRRYVNAYPSHLKDSVESNLNRFIELALEVDSGRYPSIARFLQRLDTLRNNRQDAPDELPAGKNAERVRLLTIHAAKGLEAPVIFLADTDNSSAAKEAYHAIVDWPSEASSPKHFLLALRKDDRNQFVNDIFSRQKVDIEREQANLLYVALTRARQLLYITASQARKKSGESWYDAICAQMEAHNVGQVTDESGKITLSSNSMPTKMAGNDLIKEIQKPAVITELSTPLPVINTEFDITPTFFNRQPVKPEAAITDKSGVPDHYDSFDNQSTQPLQHRGIVIHKMLQLLTDSTDLAATRELIDSMYSNQSSNQSGVIFIDSCWEEATRVFNDPQFAYLFDPANYLRAYNEVPIQFCVENHNVNGIIDRLVVCENTVYLLDYKTNISVDTNALAEASQAYAGQMSIYTHGVQRLWPEKTIEPKILFTRHKKMVDVQMIELAELLASTQSPQTEFRSAEIN